jgi:hypothetical protein
MLFKCSCHSSQHLQSLGAGIASGIDGWFAGPSLRGRRGVRQLDLAGRPAVSFLRANRIPRLRMRVMHSEFLSPAPHLL